MDALYTAVVTSNGGRAGSVKSTDGIIDLEVRPPKEMGGPDGKYANPELLFASGYAVCYGGALSHIALTKNIRVKPVITAKVTLNKEADGGFKLSVELDVNIPGVEQKVAEQLAAEAHQFCPYSKATRNNIDVTLKVSNNS